MRKRKESHCEDHSQTNQCSSRCSPTGNAPERMHDRPVKNFEYDQERLSSIKGEWPDETNRQEAVNFRDEMAISTAEE